LTDFRSALKDYYQILGVTRQASEKDIKKAYRKKCKLYHPDINRNRNAHEQFLKISEAYEYLIKQNEIRPLDEILDDQSNDSFDFDEYWEEQERARARERAEYYAKIRYEEFIKSDYYKATQAVESVFFFFFLGLMLLVFLSPVIGYFYKGYVGLGVGLFIVFATVHLWAKELKRFKKVNFKELLNSLKYVIIRKTFNLAVLGLINLLLLLKFGLSTLTPSGLFPVLYCVSILGAYLVSKLFFRLFNPLNRKYLLIAIAPGLINLFFILNYIFSGNPVKESFSFERIKVEVVNPHTYSTSTNLTTSLILENESYEKYPHIRYFLDYKKVQGKHTITYFFEDGLFGLKVMKEYEFK